MGRIARVVVPQLPQPLQSWIADWRAFLGVELETDDLARFRLHARTGRSPGSEAFLQQLESLTGRQLLLRKRGRPRQENADGE